MVKILFKVVKLQRTKALQILEEDNIEYLLSEKQLVLWNWIIEENRPIQKLAYREKFKGDTLSRTTAYSDVHKDSSLGSTYIITPRSRVSKEV